MKAVKDALHDGFGVEPSRVLQIAYEPIQYDETGALCGTQPTLGLDVHPGLEAEPAAAGGDRGLPARLPRPARMHRRRQEPPGCPAHLATGAGTGFTLVTDHIPEFTKRGICARDPKRAARGRHQHARCRAGPRRR